MDENQTLRGIIFDSKTKQPVPGAVVFQNQTAFEGIPTNTEGIFELPIEPEASKTIVVEAKNYKIRSFVFNSTEKPREYFLTPDKKQDKPAETPPKTEKIRPGKKRSEKLDKMIEEFQDDFKKQEQLQRHPERHTPQKSGIDWMKVILITVFLVAVALLLYYLYKMIAASNNAQTTTAQGTTHKIPAGKPSYREGRPQATPAPAPTPTALPTEQVGPVNPTVAPSKPEIFEI